MRAIRIADLFCGAGGTSTGAVQASRALIAAHLTSRGDVAHVMRRAANTEKLIMKGGSSESVCL
jgi:site-specific DNA-cytosine methylase